MRLKKLIVTGYRSVKGTENLITDERVTVLIGANDHGKSNLLAALQCLNDDQRIVTEDRNWDLDASAPVEIRWHFAVDEPTFDALTKVAQNEMPVAPKVEPSAAVVTDGSTGQVIEPPHVSPPVFPITEGEIVFAKDIATNAVRVVGSPVPILIASEPKLLALRPRVELFEAPSGNVVDQVTQADLSKPAFEFMQGIFRLAGLWESRDTIFKQTDQTSRKLNEASDALTKILNDKWNQGKNLKWRFVHTGTNGDTIGIQIQDPAIKERYTRPSLRSAGFRTYFLLSMIIYARSQNAAKDANIYLFDEPGTYLHPSAQLDLQRSFEAIADNSQLVYTTHSLFLINKNYPRRNRVVSKGNSGTRIDQKPFSRNWKSVRESLGILLSNNFLIADKTLLVEGPSDTIYLLDAIKRLKAKGTLDVDLNDMSIVDAGDSQNYLAMAKLMLSEGRSVVALLDGDDGGNKISDQLKKMFERELKKKTLQIHSLLAGQSSEDVFANVDALRAAAKAAYTNLISDKVREKSDAPLDAVLAEIKTHAGTTLGKTAEKQTAKLFKPEESISKLLIALKYEDEAEKDGLVLPPAALTTIEAIKKLLDLRSEKSSQSSIFEEADEE
jgi:predicted ATP-dependent endonuclease of OLD family